VLLQGAAVRVVCAFSSGHVGAAAGCSFRVLLLEWCVRFGTLLVTAGCCLGAAVRVARVRFGAGLLVPLLRVALSFEAAAAFCSQFGAGLRVPLQGAAAAAASGCCC